MCEVSLKRFEKVPNRTLIGAHEGSSYLQACLPQDAVVSCVSSDPLQKKFLSIIRKWFSVLNKTLNHKITSNYHEKAFKTMIFFFHLKVTK